MIFPQFPEADILKMLDEHRLMDANGLENDTWILLNQKAIKAAESSLEIRISSDGYPSYSILFPLIVYLTISVHAICQYSSF